MSTLLRRRFLRIAHAALGSVLSLSGSTYPLRMCNIDMAREAEIERGGGGLGVHFRPLLSKAIVLQR